MLYLSGVRVLEARKRGFLWMPTMVQSTGTSTRFLDGLKHHDPTRAYIQWPAIRQLFDL